MGNTEVKESTQFGKREESAVPGAAEESGRIGRKRNKWACRDGRRYHSLLGSP